MPQVLVQPIRFLAKPAAIGVTATVLATGVVSVASGSSQSARASAAPSPPATVTAQLVRGVRGEPPRGRRVSSARLDERVFPDARHGFALANVDDGQYPAATADGGRTWRIDGPALHLNAAQAPLAVVDVGAANARTYFACCGGQVVDATGDGGKHWWRAFLGDTVVGVVAGVGGRLIAFAQVANNGSGSQVITWVYVSRDGGRHWHYNAREGAF